MVAALQYSYDGIIRPVCSFIKHSFTTNELNINPPQRPGPQDGGWRTSQSSCCTSVQQIYNKFSINETIWPQMIWSKAFWGFWAFPHFVKLAVQPCMRHLQSFLNLALFTSTFFMQHNFHQMFPLLLSLQKCSLHVTFVLMMYMCNLDKDKKTKQTYL